ncbi:MAG: hypothetical protein HC774_02250 [Sphingomonadales bacterium]|nr:hypothetical protein [Sphingomonadales bacterium]
MTRLRLAVAALPLALAGLCLSPLAAQDEDRSDVEAGIVNPGETKGEKRLAKLLEGRVAGEPVRCIRSLPNQRFQTIDKTAYVYGSGNTIYVQRTRDPEAIDDSDALVSRRFNASEICRLDVMTTIDPVLGFFTGAVFFEDFVPYTRVKTAASDEG